MKGLRAAPEDSAADRDRLAIAEWTASLERDVAQHMKRINGGRQPSMFHTRDTCYLELLSRGLDERHARTFRGRVLLEIRCRRNHMLAKVYPTSQAPILVPAVRCLPDGDTASVRVRFRGGHRERQRDLAAAFGESIQIVRDPWIQRYEDGSFEIPGMTVLSARTPVGAFEHPTHGPIHPVWVLLCRCGENTVPADAVIDALNARQTTLRA